MNDKVNLAPKEIFSFGFKNAKKYFGPFFVWLLAYLVASSISPQEGQSEMLFARLIISLVATVYLTMSLYNSFIKISRGHDVTMKDFFVWPSHGFKAIWTQIVQSMVLLVAMIPVGVSIILITVGTSKHLVVLETLGIVLSFFSIIFLFYFLLRIGFSYYYSLETGSWAIASIKKSCANTKGRVLKLLWIGIISLGIILLGAIALLIGLLWALPTVAVAYAFVYTKLFPVGDTEAKIIVQPTEIPAHTNETATVVEDNNTNSTN